ncbi:divalent-cation tolerance protein CutA [Vibrio sp. VPAP30]|uniref:divalent-cation tolerance protein CutA n=1 Tax=Vibrio sp. VPAP30 TaxID=1647102 RepID=UPI0006583FFA|nr:divalent-cation tolerance protein CutA [Vibrio sp. VPAP30]KLN63701.1 cytochrome C biogenesis protein [Vibrio sp. VPAP30]
MNGPFCIVLTTTNCRENCKQIINTVLGKRLTACIQTMPIESHYLWQGKVCCDNETLLIMKTTKACYAQLEQAIASIHEYEVPQIVQIPFVEGFNPYLAWIEENTRC